jgi:hypothetical protein
LMGSVSSTYKSDARGGWRNGESESLGERRRPWQVPYFVVGLMGSVSSTYKSDARGGWRNGESESLGERRRPWLVPWVVVRAGA